MNYCNLHKELLKLFKVFFYRSIRHSLPHTLSHVGTFENMLAGLENIRENVDSLSELLTDNVLASDAGPWKALEEHGEIRSFIYMISN